VALIALITGHGSAPPPPVSQGCEYAPTSHAFSLEPAATALTLPFPVSSSQRNAMSVPASSSSRAVTVNSSAVAFAQYMLAGAETACADKTAAGGVIANQHGDYRDGRNGWCPGQGVRPLQWDVSAAFGAPAGAVNVSYSALSYYVGGTHPSPDGCGGDIVLSAALVFYSPAAASAGSGTP